MEIEIISLTTNTKLASLQPSLESRFHQFTFSKNFERSNLANRFEQSTPEPVATALKITRIAPLIFFATEMLAKALEVVLNAGVSLINCATSGCFKNHKVTAIETQQKKPIPQKESETDASLKTLPVDSIKDESGTIQTNKTDLLDSTASASIRELDDKLIKAIMNSDAKAVKALIAAGANVNAAVDGNAEGRAEDKYKTVLMLAAKRGNADIVKALIAAGANVNGVYGIFGDTALMEAAVQNNANIVKILIAAGANIEATNLFGRTALMEAAQKRNLDADTAIHAVKALIAAGANVEATDSEGVTALMEAAKHNNGNTVRALIAAGANPNVKDHQGRTALEWSERYGASDAFGILWRK